MKTFLVTVSALGVVASVALAECPGHFAVTASVDVEKSLMRPSVSDPAKMASAIPNKPVQAEERATE